LLLKARILEEHSSPEKSDAAICAWKDPLSDSASLAAPAAISAAGTAFSLPCSNSSAEWAAPRREGMKRSEEEEGVLGVLEGVAAEAPADLAGVRGCSAAACAALRSQRAGTLSMGRESSSSTLLASMSDME